MYLRIAVSFFFKMDTAYFLMFVVNMYVPILKARQTETRIIKDLNFCFSEKIVPLVEIINQKQDLDKIIDNIEGKTLFVDCLRISIEKYGNKFDPSSVILSMGISRNEEEYIGSLKEFNITYAQVDLLPDSSFDYEGIKNAINERTKLVTIQRSKGYATRKTLSVKEIGELIAFIKGIRSDIICMVDNCYGEFVEVIEPSDMGADMIVGSLIKNPGGGLAPIGGYICGTKECVDRCAYRLSAPGLGQEVGANLGILPAFYQGFFLAPTVVSGALKGAIFAANIYEKLGFFVVPNSTESRHDIIQAVEFKTPEGVIGFCQGIQAAAPVDSYVTPEPWNMPGYDSPVIMAAGAFIQGSSIELSADGPIKPPYAVYFQGGLTWYHAKFGILMSLQKLVENGVIALEQLSN